MKLKRKQITMIATTLLLMILAVVGATYAYFTATISDGDKGSSVIIRTGTLRLLYQDTEYINVSGVLPGSTYSKTVSVTNEGNVDVYYDLVWIELLNELSTKSDLVMSITCASSTDTCDGYSENAVASTGTNIPIIYNVEIGPLEVHTYTITLTFKETGSIQNDNQGKIISGKIGIIESGTFNVDLYGYVYDESSNAMPNVVVELHSDPMSVVTDANGRYEFPDVNLGTHTAYIKTADKTSTIMTTSLSIKYGSSKTVVGTNATVMKTTNPLIGINIYKTGSTPALALTLPSGTLKGTGGVWNYSGEYYAQKSLITSISFEDEISIPGDAVSSWDVSSNTNGSVMAYIKSDGVSGYQLHVQAKDGMYAPVNCTTLFTNFTKVTTITGLENFETKNTTNMSYMFYYMTALTSLDLSSLNTANVTNMYELVYNCTSLTSINLNNFNTSNVTDMGYMFQYCSKLTSLDLSMFDVSKVTSINSIFSDMNALVSININNWNFHSLTNLSNLFSELGNLETISLKNVNTSTITNMSYMFKNLTKLSSIDLKDLDTENVTNMGYMFRACSSLTSLDLSTFNTEKVTNVMQALYNCTALTSLNLSNWIFSNSFKPSDMIGYYNFYNTALTTVILDNVNTMNVTNMGYWFSQCQSITSLDLSDFNTANVTNMGDMFSGCTNLVSITFGTFNTANVTYMSNFFYNCQSLASVNLSSFNTAKVTNMNSMFSNCTTLTTLDMSTFNTSSLTNTGYMFSGSNALTSINMNNATFENVTATNYSGMFNNITSGITIRVKDSFAQTFINNRLSDASKTGTVTIG